MHSRFRETIFAVAAAALWAVSAHAAGQQAPQLFNLPAQPLAESLRALSKQTDTNILMNLEVIGDRKAPAIKETMTVEDVLAKLLAGTGLVSHFVDEKTVVVAQKRAVPDGKPTADSVAAGTLRVAQAQDGAVPQQDESAKLEEVVVTAQKRKERLHDVPISVVALKGENLDAQGIIDFKDLAMAVPGVAAWDSGGIGFRQLYMRGIANTRGGSPMVGIYIDDASVIGPNSNQLDLRIYDLERVEVLRGPQGTLYGNGSMGGTVRYITKDPNLNAVGWKGEVSTEFTEQGSPSEMVRGVVNLPLADGRLGTRIAATYQNVGGWIDQPEIGRKDINDQKLVNVRAKTLWQPVDALKVTANVIVHRNDTGAADIGQETADSPFRQSGGRPTTPSGSDDYDFYNLTLNYDLGSMSLVSATGYTDAKERLSEFGYRLPIVDPALNFPEFEILLGPDGDWLRRSLALTQEIRLSSTGNKRLNWTVGSFYRDSKDTTTGSFLSYFGVPFDPVRTAARVISESWTAFGQASYAVTPRLQLGAGASYFSDRHNESDAQTGVYGTARFTSTNPHVFASFDLTDKIKLYTSAAKGFRSGGFNTAAASAGFPPYKPDKVWSYELGTKMSLLDERVSFETALFYSNYQDVQINIQELAPPRRQYAINSGDAEIKGVDWELAYRLTGQLSFGFSGELVDAKMTKAGSDTVTPSHLVGDPLDEVPKNHLSTWASYEFPWFAVGRGYGRLDYTHQGRAPFTDRTFGGPWGNSSSDPLDVLNVDVGWKKGGVGVDLFVDNVLDERGFLSADSRDNVAPRERPRTYGIKLLFNFD